MTPVSRPSIDRETIWTMRVGIASIWLLTALLVVHPYYREVGAAWLARLHLPSWIMVATCVFELALGVRVLAGSAASWLCALQLGMILAFSVILAALEPMLLVHPFGVITKNLPMVALIVTWWLTEREGLSRRAMWTLRAGMALIWFTEGLFPKILFQQAMELAVVERSGLVPMNTSLFLRLMGAAQLVSFVLVLVLRGKPLRAMLWCQILALLVLPVLVSWHEPRLWVHPFGPLTKNFPMLAGTFILARKVGTC